MNKNTFKLLDTKDLMLTTLLLFALFLYGASGSASPVRPNIVMIVVDDMGYGDVSWNAAPDNFGDTIKMPHLDRLAETGVILDRHYVTSSCTPTRAELLTGRYSSRFGCLAPQSEQVLPFDTVTLASALGTQGYETALIGKWHLGSSQESGPIHFGFAYTYGCLEGAIGPYTHRYHDRKQTWHRMNKYIEEEGHATDLITDEAAKWIESRGDSPFFLFLPYTAVHVPIDEPDQWLDLYKDLPADRRLYPASCSHLDAGIGRVVEALERAGKRKDTVIIFTSDNGAWSRAKNPEGYPPGWAGGSNKPLLGGKNNSYEGGIRVPALINWPGKLEPGTYSDMVMAADWMPTLCALAGYPASRDLKWDGANIWPLLTGREEPPVRRRYFYGWRGRTAVMIEGDWKLLKYLDKEGNTRKAELYNLANDPSETTNLAKKHPERIACLSKIMTRMARADFSQEPADPIK